MTDVPPVEPFIKILEAFASAKQRGLTIIEAGKTLNMSANTLHPSIEKLFKVQLLVKSSISPFKDAISPRSANRVNIYHLQQFFPLYRPEEEEMQMNMDDTSSLRLETIILAVLGRFGVTKMSVFHLCRKMDQYKSLKKFKREINHMQNFLKERGLLVLFNEYYHPKSLNAAARIRPCIGLKSIYAAHISLNSTSSTPSFLSSSSSTSSLELHDATTASRERGWSVPRIQTARNMAQFEQLADRLNVAPCGLPSNQ